MAKYCRQDGCSSIIEEGQYCDEHRKRKNYKPIYSANRSFYRSQLWIDTANYVRVNADFKCCVCHKVVFGKNSQVDHILPVWLRPDLKLELSNLRHVCATCHPKVEYKPPHRNNKNNFQWG